MCEIELTLSQPQSILKASNAAFKSATGTLVLLILTATRVSVNVLRLSKVIFQKKSNIHSWRDCYKGRSQVDERTGPKEENFDLYSILIPTNPFPKK